MPERAAASAGLSLSSPSGLTVELNANGSLRRLACGNVLVCLFIGNEVEGGPANLYLRRPGATVEAIPLLGPASPTRFHREPIEGRILGHGRWKDIEYSISLTLATSVPAWFWHVRLRNTGGSPQNVDLTYAQDVALASSGAVRLNELYVSQYVDHSPLNSPGRGVMLASRQNQAVDGGHPWLLTGSLRDAVGFATDAFQFHGLSARTGELPPGLARDLPNVRLQHEHSMAVLRDAPIPLEPKAIGVAGFFGFFMADHPDATTRSDANHAITVLALPEARAQEAPIPASQRGAPVSNPATLFSYAPSLETQDLDAPSLQACFGPGWRHTEHDTDGTLLSFFCDGNRHVVLRAKEQRVRRPHGQILRSGRHLTPDETAMTSTVWMNGVFHSMVTQGHVSINRCLSTVHSYLGLFRSHGLRVFAEIDGTWRLLDVPSAFEMTPMACRWIYRHAGGEIHVQSEARERANELGLSLQVKHGPPTQFLVSHHIALNGDDGSAAGRACWQQDTRGIWLSPAKGSELAHRFPEGRFLIAPEAGTTFEQVGGDELLFLDGRSREQPFLCIVTAKGSTAALQIAGHLLDTREPRPLLAPSAADLLPKLSVMRAPVAAEADHLGRLLDFAPWLAQNAWVHYLSPRGLEQYSGGGWGTRDVTQGPVELLFALGRTDPIRDLLLRVLSQQNPDGDWPQWFMFFDRERNIRPGDSHGDIVYWPVLVLAQYLLATGDRSVLDERVRFFDGRGPREGEEAAVWEHAKRALGVMEKRVIPGTALAAYGHGDWNDSLQPADPRMREHLCSAWTVTLHFQTLTTLAAALESIGRDDEARPFRAQAGRIREELQRLLVVDGVLTGYALFEDANRVQYLLHPRDRLTGVRFSSLAMIHAILEDLLTPEQVRAHLALIEAHLSGPDGVRLFDRPMAYHGGPQRLFQRAESATFFGREIGLMYMHAHLRYAQALAHVGEADRFFRALCQANPIGIRSLVPAATLRQSNCYYSSSDAQFRDRYQAREEYERVANGTIALDGGWRVYSSGAGIALGLIVRRFLGLDADARHVVLDPVIPASFDGLAIQTQLCDRPVEVHYRIDRTGCGVERVELNGEALPLTFRANPHRRGAALIDRSLVIARLKAERNVLTVDLGGGS